MGSQYQKNLAKAAAVAAITLCISLGLCGLNALVISHVTGSNAMSSAQTVLFVAGYLELAAIILSFVALVVIGILILFAAILHRGDSAQ
jgi:hypothetical protein